MASGHCATSAGPVATRTATRRWDTNPAAIQVRVTARAATRATAIPMMATLRLATLTATLRSAPMVTTLAASLAAALDLEEGARRGRLRRSPAHPGPSGRLRVRLQPDDHSLDRLAARTAAVLGCLLQQRQDHRGPVQPERREPAGADQQPDPGRHEAGDHRGGGPALLHRGRRLDHRDHARRV